VSRHSEKAATTNEVGPAFDRAEQSSRFTAMKRDLMQLARRRERVRTSSMLLTFSGSSASFEGVCAAGQYLN
jgi:hypothetical protein